MPNAPHLHLKLSRLLPGAKDEVYCHRDTYAWIPTSGPTCLAIAPSRGHVDLLLELARAWTGPSWIVYILSIPRTQVPAGRYQSSRTLDFDEVSGFFRRFQPFLESDARHHIWVSAADGAGSVLYTRDQLLYAYGPLEQFERHLLQHRFRRGGISVPAPRAYHYHPVFDDDERAVVEEFGWDYNPLADRDDE